jgi:hypothetical protein
LAGHGLKTERRLHWARIAGREAFLTQAANKAYMGDEAVQRATFRLEQGTFLEYLPHYLVPFAGSSYRQESVSTLVVWTPTPEGAWRTGSASPSTVSTAGRAS